MCYNPPLCSGEFKDQNSGRWRRSGEGKAGAVRKAGMIYDLRNKKEASVAFKFKHRKHGDTRVFQCLGTAQVGQGDHKGGFKDIGSQRLDQITGGQGRSAGGNQVIHYQHSRVLGDSVLVNFNCIFPVFEGIGFAGGFSGKFSFLGRARE